MSALTAPQFFRNTDSGAPTLDNTIGDITALLDAVLVEGYPLSTATQLTYSAGKVNVNKTAHGMSVDDITTVSGADQDEYNGKVQVTDVVDADNFKYVPLTAPGVTPATGTIQFSNHGGKPGLGWQLVFTATDKRVYRPRYGNRFYWRIDQVAAYNARTRGFETMSDVDNGTGPFPTVAQMASGVWMQLTNNAAGARNWYLYGTDTFFVFGSDNTGGNVYHGYFYGDYHTYKSGDIYNTFLGGRNADQVNPNNNETFFLARGMAAAAGYFSPRSYTQTGSSIGMGLLEDLGRHNNPLSGNGSVGAVANDAGALYMPYPSAVDGGLHLNKPFVWDSLGGIRGHLRGVWWVCHHYPFMVGVAPFDTFTGSDGLSGKTFVIVPCWYATHSGCAALEISDTLDS